MQNICVSVCMLVGGGGDGGEGGLSPKSTHYLLGTVRRRFPCMAWPLTPQDQRISPLILLCQAAQVAGKGL